jgi:hypothetical protein
MRLIRKLFRSDQNPYVMHLEHFLKYFKSFSCQKNSKKPQFMFK